MSSGTRQIRSVCVYCASSERAPSVYADAAARLGRHLAGEGLAIVYGGSALGSMGRLAAAALEAGGKVTGVIPSFMQELEWAHRSLSELHVVEDMHARKRLMLELADAVVALPGGCGTLEELFEAITWKRLGLYLGPIVLVNVNHFFDPCLELLASCVKEQFLDARHAAMWSAVSSPEDAAQALRSAPEWSRAARSFAAIR